MSDFWVDLLIVRKLKNCMFPQTKMLKMLEKFWSKQVVSSGFESVDSFFNVHVVVLEVKLYPEWKPISAQTPLIPTSSPRFPFRFRVFSPSPR